MSDIIVSKYGGSSIICYEDVLRIKKITDDDSRRKVIVVSAPGKRDVSDEKVTDMLIELAKTRDENLFNRIIERYRLLTPDNNLDINIEGILRERLKTNLEAKAYEDSLKAFGEEACAKVLVHLLNFEYVDAKEVFIVSKDFGNARILDKSEGLIKNLQHKLDQKHILIIPGFYGYTQNNLIATFSRGKSDLSGAYIAASLDSILYENFTDKEGVLAADPRIVNDPKKIPELTYNEMRDLSYSGFGVFHPEAMMPVSKKMIPVHIRETKGYPKEGSYVVHERISDPSKPIIGVAYQNGFCSFNIEKSGLNEMIGVAYNVLGVFRNRNISIEFMPIVIDDMSIILKQDQLKDHSIGNVTRDICSVVGNGTEVNFQEHLGCLVVAGKGLRNRRGVSADIQKTIADVNVNIKFISQGAQERCIVYGVDATDGVKTVNALYDKYIR